MSANPLHSLPHGPAFRFLDKVLSLEPGQCATAEYTVRGDEPFLEGHFPGEPLFPGVLLVEAGAQLAGIVAQTRPGATPGVRLRLTALRAVKILGTARPGETIHFRARLLQRLWNLIQAEADATLNDRPILQAQITLSADLTPGTWHLAPDT